MEEPLGDGWPMRRVRGALGTALKVWGGRLAMAARVECAVGVSSCLVHYPAMPAPGGMNKRDWESDTVQGEFRVWTQQLNAMGVEIEQQALEDHLGVGRWRDESSQRGTSSDVSLLSQCGHMAVVANVCRAASLPVAPALKSKAVYGASSMWLGHPNRLARTSAIMTGSSRIVSLWLGQNTVGNGAGWGLDRSRSGRDFPRLRRST